MSDLLVERARPAIDLTRYAWVRELGDLRLYGTWLYTPPQDNEDTDQPCLVLVPAFRRIGIVPCVVPLEHAYLYTDPRYLAKMSLEFAKTLGFDSNLMANASRIGNMIYDHLLDLITMPENPTEAQVGAYANVKFGDGPSRSVEVLDYVPIPQA
jgi:hypothetical protein